MADPTYPALAAHLDAATPSVHTSDQIANLSSATGGDVTAALNHIHNTRPSADNTLTAGAILVGAGDGHLEASATQLSAVTGHIASTANPHGVTKAQVGLGNADNTSDADKPISTATQTALNGKANASHTHALGDLTQSGATTGQVPQWNGSTWVPATAAGGGETLLASGNFTAAASRDISVPAGYRSYRLVCRNMTHSHTAASRFQVQFIAATVAQTLRTNTTTSTSLQSDSGFGAIGVGLNADAEIECDLAGTYFRGVRSRFCGKQNATTTAIQTGGGMGAAGISNIHYSTELEATAAIDTLRLSWTLGNIAATGDYALYGVP